MNDYSTELKKKWAEVVRLSDGEDRQKYERAFSLWVRDFQREQEAEEQAANPPNPEPQLDPDMAEGYELYQRWGVD